MSWINVGEVAYVLERREGADRSREVVRELRHLAQLELPSASRILEAAQVKARHRMAFADAFAAATALAHGASLLTGDPELLTPRREWMVVDLR